jgi:hypothetical protein
MKTYSSWHHAPNRFDKLAGGSVARLRTYRNNLAHSLETIRKHRTPQAAADYITNAGYTSPLNHRYEWMGTPEQGPRFSEDGRHAYLPTVALDGLRDVGHADDILPRSISHRGWFADANQDETYRGHVWQLPARKGEPVNIAG